MNPVMDYASQSFLKRQKVARRKGAYKELPVDRKPAPLKWGEYRVPDYIMDAMNCIREVQNGYGVSRIDAVGQLVEGYVVETIPALFGISLTEFRRARISGVTGRELRQDAILFRGVRA